MVPQDLLYTPDHEWVRINPDSKTVTVGITDFAQESLGDIVFISLPDVGQALEPGKSCGEVESTKSVSEVFSPIEGVVTERNDQLEDKPELVNSDPYGSGWLLVAELTTPATGLLQPGEYEALTSTV
ncbi:MAG: glycine cleavage system protein GcvH [Candidatus Nanopelagicales bacterium]|nr:glycine cleavage system protein GcvH [Candidatus Nanopelagicales bacterium]